MVSVLCTNAVTAIIYLVQNCQQGLRERKREATTIAIEEAAVSSVEDLGYEAATIEIMCERAGISPRTFFNYFPTKDAAITGRPPTLAGTPDVEEILTNAELPLIVRLARIMTAAVDPKRMKSEITARRRLIMREHPDLHRFQIAGIDAYVKELSELVTQRLHDHPEERSLNSSIEVQAEARLCVETVGTALRFTVGAWIKEGGAQSPEQLEIEPALHHMSLILQRNS